MESWLPQCLVLAVLLSFAPEITAQKNVVCYYSSWATYRPSYGKFDIETIDPFLCTHVIYAFVGLTLDGTIRVMDPWIDVELNGFNRFNKLRNKNPQLKTLVAIGGWNEGSTVFSSVFADAKLRANFITSAYNFIKTYNFSGLDIDWEYPAQRGGSSADKANFVTVLKELSSKFLPENLLLSLAVAASPWSASISYNIPEIVKYVDFVNLMTYDFHGPWESVTGSNSPLYPSSVDTDLTINVDASVKYWLQQGAPSYKLHLGSPTYGQTYTLKSENSAGLGAVATGPGVGGKYTQQAGFLGYNEICDMMKTNVWNINWAKQQKVPFAFKGNQWVGYDNINSIRIKAEYAKMKSLGGVMIWSIENDDFNNNCGNGKFPLINSIKSALSTPGVSADAYAETQGPWMPSTLNWGDLSSTTTTASTTTTKATTTTASTTTTIPTTTTLATTTTASTTTPATTTIASTTTPATTTTASTTTPATTTTASTTTPATTTTASTTTPATTTTASTTTSATTTTASTTTPATTTTTSTTTPATTTTKATTTASTTTTASSSFTCTASGYFRDPINCTKYYYCQSTLLGTYNKINFECPTNLYYDIKTNVCDYSYNVKC